MELSSKTKVADAHLGGWRASMETVGGVLDPWRARALAAALGLDSTPPGAGDPLPPAWHWVYFLSTPEHEDLGADGHVALGGFLPPVPLPSRMWVSGRVRLGALPRLGESAQRVSRVVSVTDKVGQSGPICFVTVGHLVVGANGDGLEEEQVLVYRERQKSGRRREGVKPPGKAARKKEWHTDERMLFRYSALLFNAHRIHYDLGYCEDEGYPGLVVHGPLLATALWEAGMELAAGREADEFRYRAHAPVFHTEPFRACAAGRAGGAVMWIEGQAGDARMTAEISWR